MIQFDVLIPRDRRFANYFAFAVTTELIRKFSCRASRLQSRGLSVRVHMMCTTLVAYSVVLAYR